MSTFMSRFVGLTLILASILGLVVSVGGIVILVQNRQNLETQVVSLIDLMDSSLSITSEGFTVINDALVQTSKSTVLVTEITNDLGNSIGTSSPALESIGDLLGKELVAMIDSAQSSLVSAQSSAKVIDDTLKLVSFFSMSAPKPASGEKPLAESLGEIAKSMENLPKSLLTVQKSIEDTSKNLQSMQTGVYDLATSINQVDETIVNAQHVIGQYNSTVKEIRATTTQIKTNLPRTINLAVIGITLGLVWMAIAQIGLFTQGLELMTRKRFGDAPHPETLPEPEAAPASDDVVKKAE